MAVPYSNVSVVDSSGKPVVSQLDNSTDEGLTLHFLAALPPASFATFFITPATTTTPAPSASRPAAGASTIRNAYFEIAFDSSNQTASLTDVTHGRTLKFTQTLMQYVSAANSDPYVFRPDNGTAIEPVAGPLIPLQITTGPLFQQAVQVFSPNVSQVIRLYANEPVIHIHNTITVAKENREIITRFSTSLDNTEGGKPVFYTDNNGFYLQKRVFNMTSWGIENVTEPVAGNYYPMPTSVSIQEAAGNYQLNIVGDRAHGAASLSQGEVEVMMHRRCAIKGGIPLNDLSTIHTSLWLTAGAVADGGAYETLRLSSVVYSQRPVVLFGSAPSVASWTSRFLPTLPSLSALPPAIHLQSLRPVEGGVLLRLRHIYDVGEHPTLSQSVTVDLSQLFQRSPASVTETILSGTQSLADTHRLVWSSECGSEGSVGGEREAGGMAAAVVTMQPMTVRTFLVSF